LYPKGKAHEVKNLAYFEEQDLMAILCDEGVHAVWITCQPWLFLLFEPWIKFHTLSLVHDFSQFLFYYKHASIYMKYDLYDTYAT
jgi:hypothetical protein